ncbi:MAG TPA: hypothetical protein VFM18_13515 [Methanosarcina sp.]|nr:hypothetical protein [Methanosarcina sp.]
MRSSTVEKTVIAIEAIRDHFKTDIINTKQLNSFKENRPEIYIPVAFYHNCKTERATYDLNKFNADAVSEKTIIANAVEIVHETDEEIEARINMRFQVMDTMVAAAIQGNCRSLIVSGAPGTGKSFGVLNAVRNMPEEKVSILSGKVSPIGLFRTLWKHRFDNHVIVFDDCDSIFDNETSMNLLKAACDSSDERYITWASNTKQFDEENEEIPSTFEFNGSVVVLTNIDFNQKDNAMSPHFAAMMSRSHFVDLAIKTQREYMVRIKSVVYKSGMLNDYSDRTRDEVIQFIEMNQSSMNELSLRMVKKVADLTKISPEDWRSIASVTLMK